MPLKLPPGLLRLLTMEAEEAVPQIASRAERALPPRVGAIPESNLPILRPSTEAEIFTPLRSQSDEAIDVAARSLDDVTPEIISSTTRPGMSIGKKAAIAGAAVGGLSWLSGDSGGTPPSSSVAPMSSTPEPKPNITTTETAEVKEPSKDVDEMTSLLEQYKALSEQSSLPSAKPSAPIEIDVGEGELGTVAGLEAAQAKRNDIQLMGNLSEAADLFGSGISGRQPLPKGTFDRSKQADQQVSDFMAKVDQQKHDPNSPASKAFREYLKKFNISVKGDFSAALGEKIMPIAMRAFEAEEERNKQKFLAGERSKDRKIELLSKMEDKKKSDKQEKEAKDEHNIMRMRDAATAKEAGKLYNAYTKSGLSVERLRDAIKDPSGYKDLGVFYNYLKSLDSDSAVREAELALGMSIGNLLQQGQAAFIKAVKGELLDPSRRNQILNAVENYNNQNKIAYEKVVAPIVAQAKRLKYNLSEIIPEAYDTTLESEVPKKLIKQGYNSRTNETIKRYSDGTEEIIQGK